MEKQIKTHLYKGIAIALVTPIVFTPIVTSVAGSLTATDTTKAFLHARVLTALAQRSQELKNSLLGSESKIEAELLRNEHYKSFVQWAMQLPHEQRFDKKLFIDTIARLPLTLLQKKYILHIYLEELFKLTSIPDFQTDFFKHPMIGTPVLDRSWSKKQPKPSKAGPWTVDDEKAGGYYHDGIWIPLTPEMLNPMLYVKNQAIRENRATLDQVLHSALFAKFDFPEAPELKILYTPEYGYIVVNIDSKNKVDFEVFGPDYLTYPISKKNKFLLNGDVVFYYPKPKNNEAPIRRSVVVSGLSNFEFVPESLFATKWKVLNELKKGISLLTNSEVSEIYSDEEVSYSAILSFDGWAKTFTIYPKSKVKGYKFPKIFQKFSHIVSETITIADLSMEKPLGSLTNSTEIWSEFFRTKYGDARIKVSTSISAILPKQIKKDNFFNSFTVPTKIDRLFFYAPLKLEGDQKLHFDERMVKEFQIDVFDSKNKLVKSVKKVNVEPKYRKLQFNELPNQNEWMKDSKEFVSNIFKNIATGVPTSAFSAISDTLINASSDFLPQILESASNWDSMTAYGYPERASLPRGSVWSENLLADLVSPSNTMLAAAMVLSAVPDFNKLNFFDDVSADYLKNISRILEQLKIIENLQDLSIKLKKMSNILDHQLYFSRDTIGISQHLTKYGGTFKEFPIYDDFWKTMTYIATRKRDRVSSALHPIIDFAEDMRSKGVEIELDEDVVVPLGGKVQINAIYGAHLAKARQNSFFSPHPHTIASFDYQNKTKIGSILIEGKALNTAFEKN